VEKVISELNKEEYLVFGLVLAGGKSVRMGQDKGAIQWHASEQRYHLYTLLSGLCNQVFISCRADQKSQISEKYPTVLDTYAESGPVFALLSAFQYRPDVAWLVVACDLPLIDVTTLQQLIQYRNHSGIATTFQSPHDHLPEPLITIWEPAAFPLLQQYVADGYKCPRKVLINNPEKVTIIKAQDSRVLLNANTPEDAVLVLSLLKEKQM